MKTVNIHDKRLRELLKDDSKPTPGSKRLMIVLWVSAVLMRALAFWSVSHGSNMIL